MEGDPIKLCPQCGSEYQLWVERCLDCDAPLVHGREGDGAAAAGIAAPEQDEPANPKEGERLRTAPPAWIGRLSEDLDEAGILHWVSAPEWRQDPTLFVLPADLEAARVIDHERYALEMPEVGAARDDARPRRPARREASSYDSETKVCPSCGGEYQLWAETCADCGVPLVRPWDLESARDSEPRAAAPASPVFADPDACPACGDPLPEGAEECPGCGLMMAQPEACPNCGVELEHHAVGCRRCGYELFGSLES